MIVNIRKFGLTSLIISVLISCNSDRDVSYHELSKERIVVGENVTSSNNFDDDIEFAKLVAENSMLEMQLAALTIDRSSSDTIKRFAVSLMTDQSIFNSDIREFAERRGITLTNTLSSKSQKKFDVIAGKPAGEFDKAYCAFLVRESEEGVAKFKEEAETGNDPELKDWAARKITTLEQHLVVARGLNETKQ